MTRNRAIPFISEEDKTFVRSLIIHQDDALLVFNKPSGLPSQVRGNKARNLDHLLWAFAKSNGKRPRLVHRLDAGTSGLIIAGKTKPAAAALSKQFERGKIQKSYLALTEGVPPAQEKGIFAGAIARIETDRGAIMRVQNQHGKQARTQWSIISRSETHALFLLFPKTGRTHQIRLHLSDAGQPILGDHLYGNKTSAPRLMLHAYSLSFLHPATEKYVKFDAPLPDDFKEVGRALKLISEYGDVTFDGF